GLAKRLDLHARRRRGHGAEVGDDLPVIGELAVGADLEAEELRRRRDVGGVRGGGEEKEEQDALHGARIMAASAVSGNAAAAMELGRVAADEGEIGEACAPHPALRATLSPRSGARD